MDSSGAPAGERQGTATLFQVDGEAWWHKGQIECLRKILFPADDHLLVIIKSTVNTHLATLLCADKRNVAKAEACWVYKSV